MASKAARFYFGDTGLYLSSIVSGVADVDAITLSVAELSRSGEMAFGTGARAIILAAMSNSLVKGGIVLAAGAPSLRRVVAPGLVLMLVASLGVAFLV